MCHAPELLKQACQAAKQRPMLDTTARRRQHGTVQVATTA